MTTQTAGANKTPTSNYMLVQGEPTKYVFVRSKEQIEMQARIAEEQARDRHEFDKLSEDEKEEARFYARRGTPAWLVDLLS